MAIEELVGKHVLIVTPALNTPPEKKRLYVIGKVETISGQMMKIVDGLFTHLEERVWDTTFEELSSKDFMRKIGYTGVCWFNYQSDRMRIYPFT